jgi:hypothetical protein
MTRFPPLLRRHCESLRRFKHQPNPRHYCTILPGTCSRSILVALGVFARGGSGDLHPSPRSNLTPKPSPSFVCLLFSSSPLSPPAFSCPLHLTVSTFPHGTRPFPFASLLLSLGRGLVVLLFFQRSRLLSMSQGCSSVRSRSPESRVQTFGIRRLGDQCIFSLRVYSVSSRCVASAHQQLRRKETTSSCGRFSHQASTALSGKSNFLTIGRGQPLSHYRYNFRGHGCLAGDELVRSPGMDSPTQQRPPRDSLGPDSVRRKKNTTRTRVTRACDRCKR